METQSKPRPCCDTKSFGYQGCSCTQVNLANLKPAPWIIGQINTPVGLVPQIATRLSFGDIVGTWKARWDIGRMDYTVFPGLYAVGNPDCLSPVLVSANYKMSFDQLRQELGGLDLWVLVLDTKGVNVWCAAGKGSFGTGELVGRMGQVKLAQVVTHRKIILPQLGAPGVSAHEVYKASGFKVVYGPVRANDIPEFLRTGMKATADMREVRFGFMDRLVLTPVELTGIFKPLLMIFGLLFVKNLIVNGNEPFFELMGRTLMNFAPYFGAGLTGAVLVPVLLPFIPGRSFSWKGWLMGLLWSVVYLVFITPAANWLNAWAYLLLLPPLVSFLAMNFTGATTYTSLSGVVKEMQMAVPAQLISAGFGIILMIATFFVR